MWAKINFFEPQTQQEVRKQCIWYNSNLKVKGSMLAPNKNTKILNTMNDIMTKDGNFETQGNV